MIFICLKKSFKNLYDESGGYIAYPGNINVLWFRYN